MNDNNIKLFVVSHRKLNPDDFPDRSIIYVGPNKDKIATSDDYRDDAAEDNIADKNYTYCECTAMYYIYKHVKCDIVAIEHYRRVFGNIFFKPRKKDYFVKKLKKCDVAYMFRMPFYFLNVGQQFKSKHGKHEFSMIEEAISKLYPEYLPYFKKAMKSHFNIWCNVMALKKSLYDDYSKFLFDVLFYIEPRIKISKDPYQQRIMGFIAERLFRTYILKNNLKAKRSLVILYNKYKKS